MVERGGGGLGLSAVRSFTEPVFVNLLRSPGIDSKPGGPIRQPFLSYPVVPSCQATHRLAESIPQNRFLGSISVYKYGLSILTMIDVPV